MSTPQLPRILIIDDVFGRTVRGSTNAERRALCGQYLLTDITDDEKGFPRQQIHHPVAEASFCRGQRPAAASLGDVVENDMELIMSLVSAGWLSDRNGATPWSMVLLDLCFYTGWVTAESDSKARGVPEGRASDDDPQRYFGLTILERLHESFPDLPIIIFSSKPREPVSLQFSTRGALGFIDRSSPKSPALLREYLWRHGLIQDSSGLIVGGSRSLLTALRDARRSAMNRGNLLIRGERGTGKELFAGYIHRQTDPQSNHRPFVVVDSGTLDSQLYGSTLFGHKRGAFTGADRDRQGLIEEANGGDLFLDEIGNMPREVQAGLLRTLDQRRVAPLGVNVSKAVDVRFLSATNEDIEGRSAVGAFRPDLLDRLRQGGVLWLPALRTRPEDIPTLVQRFVYQTEGSVPGIMTRQIHPEAIDKLLSYDWPGNIRELRDCIIKAVTSHPDMEYLVADHLDLPQSALTGPATNRFPPADAGMARQRLTIDGVRKILDNFDFSGIDAIQLSGQLPLLMQSYTRFVTRLLEAALNATKRRTPDNPSGEVLIHPAVKLLTGDASISASRASDLIKRILRIDARASEQLITSSPLRDAKEKALQLRPSTRKKSI